MKKIAILEYSFLFEPGTQTWTRGSEFETDLADFLAAHGLEANIVDTVGGSGRRVMYIQAIEMMPPAPKPPPVKLVKFKK